jgi:hypothetical protein
MAALIQPQHDLSPIEIDAIEECLYNYNRRAVGRNDGRGLGFVIRDEAGRTMSLIQLLSGVCTLDHKLRPKSRWVGTIFSVERRLGAILAAASSDENSIKVAASKRSRSRSPD